MNGGETAIERAPGPGSTESLIDAAIKLIAAPPGEASTPDTEVTCQAFATAYRRWIIDHASVSGTPQERMEKVRLVLAAAAGAPDLGAALQLILRFGKLVTPNLSPAVLTEDAEEVVLRFNRRRQAGAAGLIGELWTLALLLSQLECLAGRPLSAASGTVRHADSLPEEATAMLFDQPVRFGQAQMALRLPRRYLAYAVVAPQKQIMRFAPRLVPATFARAEQQRGEFGSLLKGVLRLDRLRGTPPATLEDVAHRLGCGQATLRRRLEQEGSSFRRLRDEVNYDQARRWLLDPRFTIGTVAERLGYSDAFAFARFFQRMNGCTPAAWRRSDWQMERG